MKFQFLVVWLLIIMLAGLQIGNVAQGEAKKKKAKCYPRALLPCVPAMRGIPPSKECCKTLKEQWKKKCICKYLKYPYLKFWIESPMAKKVDKSCNVKRGKCKKK